jgi:hypothetical protein
MVIRKYTFKPTIGFHEITNDSGVEVENFAISKSLSRERCSHTATFVNLLGSEKNDMVTFNLKKLNEVDSKENYKVKISNMLQSLENLPMMWVSIDTEKLLKKIYKFQLKTV